MSNNQKNMETLSFQSEVKEILSLVINSLYSNKDIFLRELVSNASDAEDKLRYLALSDPSVYDGDGDLNIKIVLDNKANTIKIIDNGIGMDRDDIINNLGVIARSGTKDFIKKLGEASKNSNLIGQFGVGFYSSFIVADEVTVVSRKYGLPADKSVIWVSKGDGEFSIGETSKEGRGTEITLHLREDCANYANEYTIENLVATYSNHINFPILLEKTSTKKDDDGNESEVKEFSTINQADALWTKSKTDLEDKDYIEFYREAFRLYDEPLTWSHNKVEGNQEYTSLLYIPSKQPMDLYQPDVKYGIKLYTQKVFIMDNSDEFLPSYLRFVKGLVDTNSLPLNVSREILQDSKAVANLRTALTKRVLTMLSGLASNDKEKYQLFWNEFGAVLKEGLTDHLNKEKITSLLRFATSKSGSSLQTVSFDDYRKDETVKEDDNNIYYLTAQNYSAAINSPHLEWFKKNNIEVLLLVDIVDEWMINFLNVKGKKLQNIASADFKLPEVENKDDVVAETFVSDDRLKDLKDYFGDRVVDVKTTNRLVNNASVVTSNEKMSQQMIRMMKAMGHDVPEVKYTLEINPEHKLIKRLLESTGDEFNDLSELVYSQAVLAEKGTVDDTNKFIELINRLI